MNSSKLTVIMSNYNDAEYIQNAVCGVLQQRYPIHEVIIVDDGSTDNSKEVIRELVAVNSRVTMLEHAANRGVVYAFNYALQHTQTEYVCFVSMDDAINPDWLYESMSMLEKHPEAGLCCSNLYHFSTEGSGWSYANIAPWGNEAKYFTCDQLADMAQGHYISGTSVVVKTKNLIQCGGYRPDLLWHSDWFAWWVVAFRSGICFIPECLVTLQVRSSSHSSRGMADWEQQKVVIKNIFMTINSEEFCDVLPYFIKGHVMNHFGINAVKVVLENQDLWTENNFRLVEGICNTSELIKAIKPHKSKPAESQYSRCFDIREKYDLTQLGLMSNQTWHDDPKRLLFVLSRYKFVAKMLQGRSYVLEVGCADAFGTRIVQQHVGKLTAVDFDPLFIEDVKARMNAEWPLDCWVHDALSGPVDGNFDAVYALDLLEHISQDNELLFLENLTNSIHESGVVIIGSPSIHSQPYASAPSKAGHVNCKDYESFKSLMEKFFYNVFIFSCNDEVVHTGFSPMSNYFLALGCTKRR